MQICDVKVKVLSQKGLCAFDHKEGDEWIVGTVTPAGLCNAAYHALYPFIRAMQQGSKYEWPPDSGKLQLCCPDPFNPIIFDLSRVKGSRKDTLGSKGKEIRESFGKRRVAKQ
jgi:uncharacterized repeat protein (TIGR04076 family)